MPDQIRQLVVGETYVARDGDVVQITKSNAGKSSSSQRWEGKLIRAGGYQATRWEKAYRRYHSDGSWKTDYSRNQHDLVSAYAAPRPEPRREPAPVAQTHYPTYGEPTSVSQPSVKTKETSVQKNFLSNIFKSKIGQVRDGLVKFSINGPAIRTKDGSYVSYNGGALQDVSAVVFDAGDQLLFRLPVQTVQAGDVIVRSDTPGVEDVVIVVGQNAEGNTTVINPINGRQEIVVPEKNLFFPKFYVKVVSLADLGGANSQGAFGALMPFLLLGGDDFGDTDSLLPLLMFSGMGGGAPAAGAGGVLGLDLQALMPMILLQGLGGKGKKGGLFGGGEGGGLESLLPFMMLGGMGGANPLASIFGGAQAAAAPAAPAAPAAAPKA